MANVKSSSGQSEILVFFLFILLASGAVMAYNATNATNGTDFLTGYFMNGSINESPCIFTNQTFGITEPMIKRVESSKSIEVWAKTSLSIEALDNNGSYLIHASLMLDNGSLLGGYEIEFYRDNVLIGPGLTDSLGQAEISMEAAPGRHDIRAEYSGDMGRFYMFSSGRTELVSNVSSGLPDEWVSYDLESDTITITGDGVHCTPILPCTLTDIYNADQQNGWNRIENIYNYFFFSAALRIGDGSNETVLRSVLEHVYITMPWEVMSSGTLQLGEIDESKQTSGGTLFETNVPAENQLEGASALRVNSGGTLRFYGSSYKVYNDAENNIALEEGSSFLSNRFDMQRVDSEAGKTTLFVPKDSRVENFVQREYVSLECADRETCDEIREETA